ncbi:MAG: hypothetical protein K2R93_19695 [Gemmatimonadaceae bacterium]|nr:hypothetical protein [Gemmatimonadaceae bacterium]
MLPPLNDLARVLGDVGELQSLDLTDSTFRLSVAGEHATDLPERLRGLAWVRDAQFAGAITHEPGSSVERATIIGRRVSSVRDGGRR